MYSWSILFCLLTLFSFTQPIAGTEKGIDDHWILPVPSQKEPISTPQKCGQCHGDTVTSWSKSHHAHAFSPGLVGQLMDYTEEESRECLLCHAPLDVQHQAALSKDRLNQWASKPEAVSPAHYGVFCAVCHLRKGSIVGPLNKKKRDIHKKGRQVDWFSDSRFCARCHQFSQESAINGKPLENTYQEWLDSSYFQQGVTCQRCHMPEGKHLFQGIHHRETVLKGVTITTKTTKEGAFLTLRSTHIGHAFPTYVVPQVVLRGIPMDKNGKKIFSGLRKLLLQRTVSYGEEGWQEISDSRLLPGQAVELRVPWNVGNNRVEKIYFEIIVEPDHYYIHGTYIPLLEILPEGNSRSLILKALQQARSNTYTLFKTTLNQTQ